MLKSQAYHFKFMDIKAVAKKMMKKPNDNAKARKDWHKTASDFHKMTPAQAQKKYGAYGANNK